MSQTPPLHSSSISQSLTSALHSQPLCLGTGPVAHVLPKVIQGLLNYLPVSGLSSFHSILQELSFQGYIWFLNTKVRHVIHVCNRRDVKYKKRKSLIIPLLSFNVCEISETPSFSPFSLACSSVVTIKRSFYILPDFILCLYEYIFLLIFFPKGK